MSASRLGPGVMELAIATRRSTNASLTAASTRTRLVAVHLSDRVRDLVDHVLPGDGFIDWPPVAALLRESTFGGPILLEVATTHSRVKEPRLFLASAHGRARALRDAIAGRAGGSPPDSRGAPSRPPGPGKLTDS